MGEEEEGEGGLALGWIRYEDERAPKSVDPPTRDTEATCGAAVFFWVCVRFRYLYACHVLPSRLLHFCLLGPTRQ